MRAKYCGLMSTSMTISLSLTGRLPLNLRSRILSNAFGSLQRIQSRNALERTTIDSPIAKSTAPYLLFDLLIRPLSSLDGATRDSPDLPPILQR